MTGAQKLNLLDFDRLALEAFFAERGEKAFRARQLLKWIHQAGVTDLQAMTDLSKALRTRLEAEAEVRLPEVITEQHSRDGTRKWLLRMDRGNAVEMVYIPEEDRGTLCISSQVGCSLNCTFCSTAQQGWNRNLTTAEIIGQLWLANASLAAQGTRVTNVVLMGMGEPLLNFDAVVPACRLMVDDLAYGLSKRRVTLSTAGVVPGMDRLGEVCDISLAVSLHAPTDALRNELVPLNKKYPMAELMAACRRYAAHHPHRKITFEYVMLDGVNDHPEHAQALLKLLKDVPAKVNLIPFNPFPQAPYRCSSEEAIDYFWRTLNNAGIITVTRRTRGDDIDAACGQLVGEVAARGRARAGQESVL